MESLNPKDIDSRFDECMKKRQRSINESEVASSSSTSHWSSDVTDPAPPSILLSTGSGGGAELEEAAEGMLMGTANSLLSYGSISVMGRRRAMKDAEVVTELDGYQFFAVYDGHGGSSVSNACRDRLHHLLAQEVEPWTRGCSGVVDWEKVMASCFTKMDAEVGGAAAVGEPSGGDTEGNWVNTVGSSAVVVVVGQNEVVVANSGNSRAVLCRAGVAIPLSRDHNPGRPDERERVEAAGGKVIDWDGCRVLGVLATSRSIGDHYLKPYVISEPEVTISERTDCCNFLVIASDGLWDVMSNETACQVVRRCLEKSRVSEGVSVSNAAANAAALLAQLALARGSKDNITVIVVELSQSPA